MYSLSKQRRKRNSELLTGVLRFLSARRLGATPAFGAFQRCGHGRGNRARPARKRRFARPSTRSAYTYTPSGSSPAQIACFSWVALGFAPDRGRAWHFRVFVALLRGFGLAPVPHAGAPGAFVALRAAILRRRDTGSLSCDVFRPEIAEPRRLVSLSSTLYPLPRSSVVMGWTVAFSRYSCVFSERSKHNGCVMRAGRNDE